MTVQHRCFSHYHSSLVVVDEHLPVVPLKPGVLSAVSTFGTGGAGGTAVYHVAAAHRLRRRQREGDM